jgi:hypothetical protein
LNDFVSAWDSVARPERRSIELKVSDEEQPHQSSGTVIIKPEAINVLVRLAERRGARTPRLALLLRSLLTMIVGTFEVLVGDVVGMYLRLHPGALNANEREFSLEDLLAMSSIEDVREQAIARRTDEFQRRGLDGWCQWFQQHKINCKKLALDWEDTREVFERRNIIVHNAGRVSQQYIDRVGARTAVDPKIGSEISLSKQYVAQALDQVMVLGLLVALCSWHKLVVEE